MCKAQPAQISPEAKSVLEEVAQPGMDSHLLLDSLTLSAVAILLIILLLAKLVKKQKKLASIQSSATQTTVWDTDIEKALTKMSFTLDNTHSSKWPVGPPNRGRAGVPRGILRNGLLLVWCLSSGMSPLLHRLWFISYGSSAMVHQLCCNCCCALALVPLLCWSICSGTSPLVHFL